MEALILGDSDEKGPNTEETNLVLSDPAKGMVKKQSMALDRWCPAAQVSGGQASAQSTTQQTTPLVPQQQRKCQNGIGGAVVRDNTLFVTHLPTQVLGWSTVPLTNKTPQETQPSSQPIIIGS